MEEIIKKLKKYLESIDNKKFIVTISFLLILSVVLLMVMDNFMDKSKNDEQTVLKENSNEYNYLMKEDYESYIEGKLSNILTKLKGVGQVDVMVVLEDSTEKIPASNISTTIEHTNELDAQGGSREISREDESIQVVSTSNELVVLKEIKPSIKGVIVVAEGAEDLTILENLYEAVKTVLGISGNRVQIFPSK